MVRADYSKTSSLSIPTESASSGLESLGYAFRFSCSGRCSSAAEQGSHKLRGSTDRLGIFNVSGAVFFCPSHGGAPNRTTTHVVGHDFGHVTHDPPRVLSRNDREATVNEREGGGVPVDVEVRVSHGKGSVRGAARPRVLKQRGER